MRGIFLSKERDRIGDGRRGDGKGEETEGRGDGKGERRKGERDERERRREGRAPLFLYHL